MKDPFIEKLKAFLKEAGSATYEVKPLLSGHRLVRVSCGGRQAVVTISSARSDRTGPRCMVRDLRHQLGLVGTRFPKTPSARRRRPHHRKKANAAAVIISANSVTISDRYYGPLAQLRRRMLASAHVEGTRFPQSLPDPQSAEEIVELRTPFLGRKRRFWGRG